MQRLSRISLIPERNRVVLRRCGEQVPLHGVERYGVHFSRVRLEKEGAVRLAEVVEEHIAIITAGGERVAVVGVPCNALSMGKDRKQQHSHFLSVLRILAWAAHLKALSPT